MNAHKRLTNYLTGPPPARSYSQENYFNRSNMTFMNRNPPVQTASVKYSGHCNNHSHHCCCPSQPHHAYFAPAPDQTVNDLREEVKRQRFENKLLLKELESKQLFRDRNSDLNHKLSQKIDEISKLNKQLGEQSREIQILKESNNWLKQEALQLRKAVEEADRKLSQKERLIGDLETSNQNQYVELQRKLAEVHSEVRHYREKLQELRETHKIEDEWRRDSTKKIQGKLRSNNQISLCIQNDERYPLSRSTQTYMSGVDIDYGLGNLSKEQDRLCEKINQNIIAEDTLFRRIRGIEDDLGRGLQILASVQRMDNQLQLENLRMNLDLGTTR